MVKGWGRMWCGSTGHVSSSHVGEDTQNQASFARIESLGARSPATASMPTKHYLGYYEGFANSGLWPALHSRPDLIQVSPENYTSYREINAFMARALLRFNTPEAMFWVQDYHLLTLGVELRKLDVDRPIGFFLHTPWAEWRPMMADAQPNDLRRGL